MNRAYGSLLRLIAAGLVFLGVIGLAVDAARWMQHRTGGPAPGFWAVALDAGLLTGGMGLFAGGRRLAKHLIDDDE